MQSIDLITLNSILDYYRYNWEVDEDIDVIRQELIDNNVEVRGDSFYCPIWNEEHNLWVLLAGTKDKADTWVLKKIIKLIKSGDKIVTVLNGNSDYLVSILSRYNVKVVDSKNDMKTITFN